MELSREDLNRRLAMRWDPTWLARQTRSLLHSSYEIESLVIGGMMELTVAEYSPINSEPTLGKGPSDEEGIPAQPT